MRERVGRQGNKEGGGEREGNEEGRRNGGKCVITVTS